MHITPTHYGLMYGIVPVYLDMTNQEEPVIETRWWVPEIVLDIADGFFGVCVSLMQLINPYYEPLFPIKITGKFPHRSR